MLVIESNRFYLRLGKPMVRDDTESKFEFVSLNDALISPAETEADDAGVELRFGFNAEASDGERTRRLPQAD